LTQSTDDSPPLWLEIERREQRQWVYMGCPESLDEATTCVRRHTPDKTFRLMMRQGKYGVPILIWLMRPRFGREPTLHCIFAARTKMGA
jgi:hypothetical protein